MNQTALFSGLTYRRLEMIRGLDDATYVLCESENGERFVCPLDRWEAAAPAPTTKVHSKSSSQDKIALFLERFRGREDVYAKRWYNFNSQKSGYSPACRNEWERGVCDKKKHRCADCPNREFIALSSGIVRAHLIGRDEFCRDVAGIYPLLPDDTTWLLCADFDDGGWQEDVRAFCDAAASCGLTPAVERSRSGEGAHVWFFFETPVSASDARKLGSLLLTRAMAKRHELSFRSYDRLFPSQDTMPKGGFGNLIALPFQGQAQKNGNSLFVDEHFVPYPDQWAYLSALPRITEADLGKTLSDFRTASDTGTLADSKEKPWERGSKQEKELTILDFPLTVSLTLADRLYVEKTGFSQAALNRIKRLAAFRNPDFYKSQAMRLPIYDKPRVIDCGEEKDDYLILPRGCISTVCELLDELGVPFTCSDQRNSGRQISVRFNGTLRPEQVPAAEALFAHDMGVLSATTAFGKTVIGAYLIGERKTNTLILVHSTALLAQWKQALEQFLTIDEMLPEEPKKRGRRKKRQLIGQLGGGKNSLSGIVDIAIMQSLFEGEDKHVKELVAEYGMVICDECHHVAAFSFEKVMNAVRAKYVYGLSATPTRQDGHHPIIFMQCGPVRYLVDAKQQAQQRSFSHFLIPRMTKTRLPDAQGIQDVYTAIVKNELRNAQIVRDAISAIKDARTPIVLTERREHAEALYAVLQNSAEHVFLLLGSDSAKEKREKLNALRAVPENETLLIIATGKYIGEGFDEPRLDTLFLAMPFSWKGTLAQYVGRLHRNYEGKREVRVYDYVDVHVPMLERMYHRRLKGYAELGYQTLSDDTENAPGMIYTGQNYSDAFGKDILSAGRELVLSSPTLARSRIAAMLSKIPKGIKLRVITRSMEGYSIEQQARVLAAFKLLEDGGAEIITQPQLTQRYAVLDGVIVWYGDINFLSSSKPEDTAIRLESPELAGELLDLKADCE